jgi:WD40 repeat protein
MLEITIQRRVDGGWPVVAERHNVGTLLPVRSEGRLELVDEPSSSVARTYGTTLGQMLFRDAIRDAFVQVRSDQSDGARVLLFVEADELKSWRWEWLCAPVDSISWDFLSLDQRVLYSLYLPSLTNRAYPPIGRNDLRALVVVANPADPEKRYGLASFDVGQNVARLRSIFGERTPAKVLARVAGAGGAPTLDAIETHLTGATPDRPYTILHLVCHGWFNPHGEGETTLYLERPSPDPVSGQVLAQPVQGSELIARLRHVGRLPYLVFLSTCESAAPEAEQRLGGLAQRLVRELGIPAVVGMTERVTIATAHALAEQFYDRLFAQKTAGEVDRALVEAYAGLAARSDVNVPALYSRLGTQPLFSTALDRPLTAAEIKDGLQKLDDLLAARAPVLRLRLAESAGQLRSTLATSPEALTGAARQERDQALTRVNELCSEAVEISFHALAQGEQPPAYDARQPFRGLSPFRAEDREFFFGRDSLVEKLRQKLSGDNFLAVLGSSGSGKSSLVLAGLAPKLKAQIPGLQVIDDLTPGSAPLEQLRVRQSRLGSGPMLYIVDQFEELFTLCKDEGQRRAFIDELLSLAQSHRVVLTMRADFWGECARYAALKDRMLACQELVAPMTAVELRSAMEQQAAKVGLRFEADLSNSMLDEVAGEPGAMPLLQHALLELWKRRHGRWMRAEEYRAIGGVKQAIAETADRLYDELSDIEKRRMREIFLRLTRLDESLVLDDERRDTRRRLSIDQLVPAGADPEPTKLLVKRLADAVLLVTSRNELTGTNEVEVAHEALIRHWGKLRTWLDEDRGMLRLREGISEAAKEYEQKKDDYSRLVHRGRRLKEIDDALEKGAFSLNNQEQRYISACRNRRYWVRFSFGAAGLAVVAFAVIGLFVWLSEQAKQETQRELRVVQAVDGFLAANNPYRALATALDAIGTMKADAIAPELVAAVSRSVPQRTLKTVLRGHKDSVLRSFFVSNNDAVVTLSSDNNIGLWDRRSGRLRKLTPVNLDQISLTAVSPDGRLLALLGLDESKRTNLRLWEFATGSERKLLSGASVHILSLAFGQTKDGLVLVGLSAEGQVVVWNAETGSEIRRVIVPLTAPAHVIALASDGLNQQGTILAIGSDDGQVGQWLLDTDSPPRILNANSGSVTHGAFGAAGRFVFVTEDGQVWLSNSLSEGPNLATLGTHDRPVTALVVTADGRLAATASRDGTVWIWDLATGKARRRISPPGGGWVNAVDFSADGTRVAIGTEDGTVLLVDVVNGDDPVFFRGHRGAVFDVRFSADAKFVVSGSTDGTARIWNANGAEPPNIWQAHNGPGLVVKPEAGKCILTWGGTDKKALVWCLEKSASPIELLSGSNVAAGALSSEGDRAFIGTDNGEIVSWNLTTSPPRKDVLIPERHGQMSSLALSVDEDLLAGVGIGDSNQVVVCTILTSNCIDLDPSSWGSSNTALGWGRSVAFSPRNKRLLGSTHDGDDKGGIGFLWDLQKHTVQSLIGHKERVAMIRFSKCSDLALTVAIQEDSARVWDTSTGKPLAVLKGHQGRVTSAQFSPDCNSGIIATSSFDGTIRLWSTADLGSGSRIIDVAPRRTLAVENERARILAIDFDPTGTLLASASNASTIWLWHIGDNTVRAKYRVGTGIDNVLFSPDGLHLFATGGGVLLQWDVPPLVKLSSAAALLAYSRSVIPIPMGPSKSNYTAELSDSPSEKPLVPTTCPLGSPSSVGLPPHQINGALRSRQVLRLPNGCSPGNPNTDPYVTAQIAEFEGDFEVARKHYKTARGQSNYRALIGLGDLLYRGDVTDGGFEEARNNYIDASKHNVPLAASRLGWLSTFKSDPLNRLSAGKYFSEGASRGEADGFAGLGWIIEQKETLTNEERRNAFVNYAAAELLYTARQEFSQAQGVAERRATLAELLSPDEIPMLLNRASALATSDVQDSWGKMVEMSP